MKEQFYAKAYAKVNFNLKVYPKDDKDCFHNIESIFQTVDLYDELTVTLKQIKGCSVQCQQVVLPAKNTLTSAYDVFCEVAGVDVPGINVELKKGIPSGGGLGGGSSDAAALVRLLQKICGLSLSENQLDYIADKTGSDVFFFMHCDSEGKGAALVSGRGQIIKKIASRDDLFLLLIFPKLSSSTKEAYMLADDFLAEMNVSDYKVDYPLFEDLEAVYRADVEKWVFKNTFTMPLCRKYSEISCAMEDLRKSGALFSDMSGSGSTVFGVFTLRQQAMNSCSLLAGTWNCVVVQTI
ncbi:MAG: 4-(cytidine 5'-diphospho)-2-C-methyl-D-erythritol kinase [Treponema sp.]|nr:4-(cytidine 5'-diphospho)-2-C-methyl-D-erythritol kinase [Treponema sp.]